MPDAGCAGYELAVDLDFDTDGDGDVDSDEDYWNGGAGWDPIADRAGSDDTAKFDATFEGNGHAVTNLFINQVDTDDVGLFNVTRTDSELRNVGLTDANITGGS